MCNIFINIGDGLGNKLLNVITLLYIKQEFNCNIYLGIKRSIHNKNHTSFDDVFYKLKDNIQFKDEKVITQLLDKYPSKINVINGKNVKKIQNIKYMLKENNTITNIHKLWKFIGHYIKTIKYNDYLNINPKYLPKMKNNKYCCIHIRYGDKLCYLKKTPLLKDLDCQSCTENTYILYTPEYYIDMINKYSQKNIPIIIVTDTPELVNNEILNNITNKNNIFLSKFNQYVDLYIMMNAYYLILSHSTLSFVAGYFNKYNNIYLVERSKNNKNYGWGNNAINENWNIIYDNKYILNYNDKKKTYIFNKYILNNIEFCYDK